LGSSFIFNEHNARINPAPPLADGTHAGCRSNRTRKKVIHEEHLENPSQSFPGRTLEPDSGQKYFEFQIPAQAGGGDELMPGPGSHAKPGGIGMLDAGGGGMEIVRSAITLALDSSGGRFQSTTRTFRAFDQ
jgi:hypothetical protein